jgi:hypothetical protein
MTAKIAIDEWAPLPGSLPTEVDPDKVYVVPTRLPSNEGLGEQPLYVESVRYVPKEARAVGAPVEFATPEGSRRFVQEFSADVDTWALALLCFNMANDWLIFAVGLFIATRSKAEGWSEEEAKELPLKVSVVEAETGRTYEIEGKGSDVLAALQAFHKDATKKRGGEKKKGGHG